MNPCRSSQLIRSITAAALVALCVIPQTLFAQASEHLVSRADLQKAAVDASQKRQQNLETLNQFFSSAKAQQALKSANMSQQKVENSIASLSDEELARLASKASKAQSDFAAGSISDRDLLIILVAVAALILVVVAVR
jgi:hypothetical protein